MQQRVTVWRSSWPSATTCGVPRRPQGSGRWEAVFAALGTARVEFALPEQPLFDLLDAFRQDVEKTRDRAGYRDRHELPTTAGAPPIPWAG